MSDFFINSFMVQPSGPSSALGVIDTTFQSNIGSGPQSGGGIYAIEVQSDGKILVGGDITEWNGSSAGRIVRLNSNGTLDTTFFSNIGTGFDGKIKTIKVQSDGKILVGGEFSTFQYGGVRYFARLNSNGTYDTAYNNALSPANNFYGTSINAFDFQSNGKMLVGGPMLWSDFTFPFNLYRFNTDGTRDTVWNTNIGQGPLGGGFGITDILVEADDKVIIAGDMDTFNGVSVGGITRLNSNGTRDTAFPTSNSDGDVYAVKKQTDGKIVAGGQFSTWASTSANGLVRLNSDYTVDTSFLSNIGTSPYNNDVRTISIDSNGKILIGGQTTNFNTVNSCLVCLNSDGTTDTAFQSNIGYNSNGFSVYKTKIQSDGKILVGGNFPQWNSGTNTNCLVRLI